MTRGLYPPESLSKEDVRTLAKVRQEMWSNAFIGGGFGAGSGLVLHTAAQWGRRLGLTNAKLNRNTLMLAVLGGGSLGMFLFATSKGKEQVHNLHPIFQVGAMPPGELDRQDYRNKMMQAADEESSSSSSEALDITKMQERRMTRRQALMDGFQKGHGLNDAHGGHWFKENEK